ncbi:hypothetical protein JDV02_009605 [Purpureocillium takamizusanense]|uniref:NADP-dependent oxidoreductase domain-containing protein n=1 Tax=Purpureocillium takamizusanense TaxID=2060973 RepID=A0A9Q8VGD2_9HYPO|nr:uncharacterized protein JDV02_009605 [Purpureocillium takamizusanense]UNI23809.1 hypothetical protein JDV02_009605 [Purpureocillium takamizusanense]
MPQSENIALHPCPTAHLHCCPIFLFFTMAGSSNGPANGAHVNMMTDTIIANLPPEGLRAVMRLILVSRPDVTPTFEAETRKYLGQGAATSLGARIHNLDMDGLKKAQQLIRCMLGSGIPFEGIPWLGKVAVRAANLAIELRAVDSAGAFALLASIDGDVVQAMTAVQKALFSQSGVRTMSIEEKDIVEQLFEALNSCQEVFRGAEYPYRRSTIATASTLGVPQPHLQFNDTASANIKEIVPPAKPSETFTLNGKQVPRIFSGLWQMSSPAWGPATTSKIIEQFSVHAQNGFTAFDMADHYGDAEIIFGQFRSYYPFKDALFTATKYCVFHPVTISRDAVHSNVTERCKRLQLDKLDLLQVHWQFYENPQYLDAIEYIMEDDRVGAVGLCNFDTAHLETVLNRGLRIYTNQVQFSLIDSRPTEQMGQVCERHGIKLITYGTLVRIAFLCG